MEKVIRLPPAAMCDVAITTIACIVRLIRACVSKIFPRRSAPKFSILGASGHREAGRRWAMNVL